MRPTRWKIAGRAGREACPWHLGIWWDAVNACATNVLLMCYCNTHQLSTAFSASVQPGVEPDCVAPAIEDSSFLDGTRHTHLARLQVAGGSELSVQTAACVCLRTLPVCRPSTHLACCISVLATPIHARRSRRIGHSRARNRLHICVRIFEVRSWFF